MKWKLLSISTFILLLSACSSDLGGKTEMYGEIKTGIETSHTKMNH